jgi:hypothetical protein
MVLDQHLPVLRRCVTLFDDALAALLQDDLLVGAAKGIGAGINRVLKDAPDQPRRRLDESNAGFADPLWQLDPFAAKPQINLPCAAQFPEFFKDQRQCPANLLIWIFFENVIHTEHIAFGNARVIFTTPCHLPNRFLRALPEH